MQKIISIIILFFIIVATFIVQSYCSESGTSNQTESNSCITNQIPKTTRANGRNVETWTISGPEEIMNETTIINKSIIIKSGGVLNIENSTIEINSSQGPVIFTVEEGGRLIIEHSKLTSHNLSFDFGYNIQVYGEMILNDSIINYPGYILGVYPIKSCSEEYYREYFSPGIEVKSDNVEITNSEFNFALNTSIFIMGSSPKIYNNVFFNNTISITILDSNVILDNIYFNENIQGMEIARSNLELVNSTFINMKSDGIFGYSTVFNIRNTIFENCENTLYCEESTVSIDNSTFNSNGGLGIRGSNVNFVNSKISSLGGFYLVNVTGMVKNNSFENCISGIALLYSKGAIIENNSIIVKEDYLGMGENIGIGVVQCQDILIENNLIQVNTIGISVFESDVIIINNTVYSKFAGISLYIWGYEYIVKNNIISNCSIGIIIESFEGEIINNTIVQNQEGISCSGSNISINNNLIANNSDWGINITGVEPILTENRFSDQYHKPNGKGRIIKMFDITFRAKDAFGYYISDYFLSVFDKDNNIPIYEEIIGATGRYDTQIPIYKILNSGEKQEISNLVATASWGNEYIGYIENSKTFRIPDTSRINFTIPLPDLYLTRDDITISNPSPKDGDVVEFMVTVHYNGKVPARNISVTLTVHRKTIKEQFISFEGSDESQSQTFSASWTVPVSSTEKYKKITVSIDPDNPVENHRLNYERNNTVLFVLNVTADEEPVDYYTWEGSSGTVLCSIIVIILIVILLIIIAFMIKRKAKKKKHLGEPPLTMKELEAEYDKKRGPPPRRKGAGLAGLKKGEKPPGEEKDIKSRIKGRDIDKKKIDQSKIKPPADSKKPKKGTKQQEPVKPTKPTKPTTKKKSLKEKIAEDYTRDGPRIKW